MGTCVPEKIMFTDCGCLFLFPSLHGVLCSLYFSLCGDWFTSAAILESSHGEMEKNKLLLGNMTRQMIVSLPHLHDIFHL